MTGRFGPLSLDDARDAARRIANLSLIMFRTEVTLLPYPGLGIPPDRPPMEFHYIGSEWMMWLVREVANSASRKVVIVGPRGYGKSSDLRALAVCLCSLPTETNRYVCIWNMAEALHDVVMVVRDAILFAYLVAFEVEKLEAAASANEEIQKKLEEEIQNFSCMADAVAFVKRRRREHREAFCFFVDGWEYLDETDSRGVPADRQAQRQSVRGQLDSLFSEGNQVWLSASAKANAAKWSSDCRILYKSKPFDDMQFSKYKSSSVLEKLSKWQEDIEHYTGRVPLFLDVLCDCCTQFATRVRVRALRDEVSSKKRSFEALKQALCVDQQTIVDLLEDDTDNWDSVLKLFREHPELKRVEDNINKITLEESCYSIQAMGSKDVTYFDLQEQRYCSDYIQRLYVKGFRDEEEQFARDYSGSAWLPYCGQLLMRQDVNWSAMGWVVEDLVADVVVKWDVDLGTTLGKIPRSVLHVQEFREVPRQPISELIKWKPGRGVYWKPRDFNFPYVDSVIGYLDLQGCLHIIALQVTSSVEAHLLSAELFMSYQYLKVWFPDIVEVDKDNGKEKAVWFSDIEEEKDKAAVQLHFVYIGCSEEHKEEVVEKDMKQVTRNLKGGKLVGTAGFRWTFVPLNKAFAALDSEAQEVVGDIVRRRKMCPYPTIQLPLGTLTRKELDQVATQYGLNPRDYKTKSEIVTAVEVKAF